MAERKVTIPSARVPLVDDSGRIDPSWFRFLVDLHERTGGATTDKVDSVSGDASNAQASADAAQASANTAQTSANNAQTTATTATNDLTTLKGAVDGTSTTLGFYGTTPSAKPTITGSRGGNAAVQDLLSKLDGLGILTDSTT